MHRSIIWAVAALATGVAACSEFLQRNEATALRIASHNFAFRNSHDFADRLFNGFDYGHATLYEAFATGKDGKEIEGPLFDYIMGVNDDPPRLMPAEDAIAPHFTRAYWRVQNVFDWAHGLHRQINDILADDDNPDRHAAIEEATDYYLRQPMALHSRWKRMDVLMNGQPYSGEFRRRYPKWNGIIWAYHWFQNGVYEPFMHGRTPSERAIGIDAAAALFQCSRYAPPDHFPTSMPMSWQVAPAFARMHARAAAIFDNLHMLHDIVSDVLLSDKVTDKRGEMERMIAIMQDATSHIDESANRGMGPGGMEAMMKQEAEIGGERGKQGYLEMMQMMQNMKPAPSQGGGETPPRKGGGESQDQKGGKPGGGMQHEMKGEKPGGDQKATKSGAGGGGHAGMTHGASGMAGMGKPPAGGPGAACADGLRMNPPAYVGRE